MKPKEKLSIVDVAKQAGVSNMTVSRVINDAPGVSEETAARIRGIMEEMGYVPPAPARRNRRMSARRKEGILTENITLLIPDEHAMAMRTPISAVLTQGISEVLSDKRLELMLSHLRKGGALPQCIEKGKVDGVIVRGFAPSQHKLLNKLPLVQVFSLGEMEELTFDLVNPDINQALRLGLEDLLDRGCKRIGYVTEAEKIEFMGYGPIWDKLQRIAEDRGAQLEWVSLRSGTCISTEIDGILSKAVIGWEIIHLIRDLEALGRIPGQTIELAVLDYAHFCPDMNYELTMVDLQMSEVGKVAAKHLLHRMKNPDAPPERVRVPPRVERLAP